MKNAKERVKIHTPYIICNDMMYNTWKEIAERVPDFSIMTNSVANNGNPFGSADYARNRCCTTPVYPFENIVHLFRCCAG